MKRSLIVIVACVALVAPAPVAAGGESGEVLVRKNVKELSATEKAAFVDAILRLKATPSPYDPSMSYYDQFVWWHRTLYVCADGSEHDIHRGHAGPWFLPWHRAFIHLFERALGEVSGQPIAIPYWDWSDPQSTSLVFANDLMGGDGSANAGYAVTTGPFRKGAWELTVEPKGLIYTGSSKPYLVRRFGSGGRFNLPPVTDVAWALSAPRYDAEPFDTRSDPNISFRAAIEGFWRSDPTSSVRFADPGIDRMHCGPDGWVFPSRDGGRLHNQVHTWTGGVVADASDGPTVFGTMFLSTSPNDPVFFLNHANIDRLWAKWQGLHGSPFEPKSEKNVLIEPFTDAGKYTPKSVESTMDLGYTYSSFIDSDDALVPPASTAQVAGGPTPTYVCKKALGKVSSWDPFETRTGKPSAA